MKTRTRQGIRGVVLVAIALASLVDRGRACSDGPWSLIMTNAVWPADVKGFERGRLGIVQPTFGRIYLVKAYRYFANVVTAGESAPASSGERVAKDGLAEWMATRGRVPGVEALPQGQPEPMREAETYNSYVNCTDSAFATAAATLDARAATLGADSPEVKAWVAAQDQVFANCGTRKDAVIPADLPSSASAPARADRAYQIAAAHFYSGGFDEAESRFRAIAADRQSPWHDYGLLLAARSLIRKSTLTEPPRDGTPGNTPPRDPTPLRRADETLNAVLADPGLSRVHAAARQLRGFVGIRIDPVRRAHELSAALRSPRPIDPQDETDFVLLMDSLVGNTTTYEYDKIQSRDAIAADDDLLDWILAMQGTGASAGTRALARWQQTNSMPWLVAALWSTLPSAPDAPALLDAAARVPKSSTAWHTVTFLRVRMLIARGDREAARQALGTVSMTADDTTPVEAANLFRAQALLLARSMPELLTLSMRAPGGVGSSFGMPEAPEDGKFDKPTIDYDGMKLLSERLPMSRLVEGLKAKLLPPRLQWRLAAMAFTRAVMLGRDEDGIAAAAFLSDGFPAIASELKAYSSAADHAARHRTGILLIVRHPGLHAFIGAENDATYQHDAGYEETFHAYHDNWWCAFKASDEGAADGGFNATWVVSSLPGLTSYRDTMPVPEFLSAEERAAMRSEFEALAKLGAAPNWLLNETIAWARERPTDPLAAEALARAIQQTRWSCGDENTGAHAKTAFGVLHSTFPRSSWARQTKYWYDPTR